MIKQFYVAIELAKVGRISIATELATIESSAAHDRARHEKTGAYDSVAPCCVTIEEAMHARQTRPDARDIPSQEHTTSLGHAR